MVALKRDDLLKMKKYPLNDNRVVCSQHFEDCYYMCPALRHNDGSLLPSAVPSVFVYQTAGRTMSHRKAPTRRTLHPTKQKLTSSSSVLDLPSTSAAGLPSPAPALSTTPLWQGRLMVSRSALRSRLWRARRVQGAAKTLQMKLQSCQPNDKLHDMLERLPKHQKPFIGLQLWMAGRRKVAAYTEKNKNLPWLYFTKDLLLIGSWGQCFGCHQ